MKIVALVFGALAAMVIAGAALAGGSGTQDQGRRLTGPFCINKKTGVILSVGVKKKCKPGYVRKYGVGGPQGGSGPKGPAGPKGATGAKRQGDTGAKGDTGATGPAGQTLEAFGAQGPQGKTGPQGETGPRG